MPENNDTYHNREINGEDEKRLLDLYQNEYKKFEKSFGILLGFALVFLFIILLPYISTLERGYSINQELANLTSDINEHIRNIDYLNSAENSLGDLNVLLSKFPSELEKSFINLRLFQISLELDQLKTNVNKFFSQPQSDKKIDEFLSILNTLSQKVNSIVNLETSPSNNFAFCTRINATLRTLCNISEDIYSRIEYFVNNQRSDYALDGTSFLFPKCDTRFSNRTNDWASCNLNEKIHNQIEEFDQILLQNISSPLKLISNGSQHLDIQNLQVAFNDLRNYSFKAGPTIFSVANSNSNTTGRGLSLLTSLSDDIRFFKKEYNETIEPARAKFVNDIQQQGQRQDSELKQLNGTKILLIEERRNSTEDRKKIEARINQTQFPFGTLPINLDEAIAAFPVALGIGFVLSSSYLVNSINLRKELHNHYKIKYKETETKNIDQRISLLASLWIDPTKSKSARIAKFVIFIIPFLIFVLSCYMIFYYIIFRGGNQFLTSLFSYGFFINAWTYTGLYLLCAALFIYGTLNILLAIRRYPSST